jgi:hypothetical protein
MRINSVVSWCCFLFLLLWLPAAMGLEKIACPASVQVADPRLLTPIQGWTAIAEKTPHQLSAISFYDGPIEEGASLVPDRNSKAQKTSTSLWQLDTKSARGYWLACRYSGTSLLLGRALPKGLSQCAVTYNNQEQIDGMQVVENLSCK